MKHTIKEQLRLAGCPEGKIEDAIIVINRTGISVQTFLRLMRPIEELSKVELLAHVIDISELVGEPREQTPKGLFSCCKKSQSTKL